LECMKSSSLRDPPQSVRAYSRCRRLAYVAYTTSESKKADFPTRACMPLALNANVLVGLIKNACRTVCLSARYEYQCTVGYVYQKVAVKTYKYRFRPLFP
jgi:hypothetical protein